MMHNSKRLIVASSYILFVLALVYLAGFLGSLVVPSSVDDGLLQPLPVALVFDVSLLALLAIQHRLLMKGQARSKELTASLRLFGMLAVLALVYAAWMPIPLVVWQSTRVWLDMVIWAIFGFGWGLALISVLLPIQPRYGAGRRLSHPFYPGLLIALWAIPTMTLGHLLFAAIVTGYLLIEAGSGRAELIAMLEPGRSAWWQQQRKPGRADGAPVPTGHPGEPVQGGQ